MLTNAARGDIRNFCVDFLTALAEVGTVRVPGCQGPWASSCCRARTAVWPGAPQDSPVHQSSRGNRWRWRQRWRLPWDSSHRDTEEDGGGGGGGGGGDGSRPDAGGGAGGRAALLLRARRRRGRRRPGAVARRFAPAAAAVQCSSACNLKGIYLLKPEMKRDGASI
jgi:hypothetical protein